MAIKILDEDHRDDAGVARLAKSSGSLRLKHPHHRGVRARRPLDDDAVHRRRPDQPPRVDGGPIEALAQVADAPDCTHRSGIAYTDVKPTNPSAPGLTQGALTRCSSRRFRAAHIPLRRWNRPPFSPLTPCPAPNCFRGAPPCRDRRVRTGVHGPEVLTGLTLYAADNASDLIDAHLHRPPPDVSCTAPWLTRSFDVVSARAIAKDPTWRYES